MMKQEIPFFKTIWLALNPWNYDELKDKSTGDVFRYFFSFVFLAFLLAVVLMLPAIANFFNSQISHFDTLEIRFNTTMNSPIIFPQNDPFVTLDTRVSEGNLKEGRFLITDDYVYSKKLTGGIESRPVSSYKDLLANEGIMLFIVLLMTPSLLFLFYLVYTLKVMIIVIAAALIALIVTRVIKFEITLLEILKTGLLASTPMIIIDLIRLPFGFNVYYAQYIAFLVFLVVGIIRAGDFEGMSSKKHGRKRGYIDLGKKF